MKNKLLLIVLSLSFLFALSCSLQPKEEYEESFTVHIICQSKDIYQIYYTGYFNDTYDCMGGIANVDHTELTADSDMQFTFTKSYLEDRKDVSSFSMDFSPYGKDDTSEIATTDKVYIHAEYGNEYTVIFAGDKDSGFTASLKE